jgi:hypothetical protein
MNLERVALDHEWRSAVADKSEPLSKDPNEQQNGVGAPGSMWVRAVLRLVAGKMGRMPAR